ncbi:hypothetical protein Y956_11294, partial [Nipponia nippon]
SQSAWVCQGGPVYSCIAVFILVPQYTQCTKAQKEHRCTGGDPLTSLPVM